MLTVRKSAERHHVQSRSQNPWMTFDPENVGDPLHRGFRGLESLNEEQAGPEKGLHPNSNEGIELVLHAIPGRILLQDQSLRMRDGVALIVEAAASFTAQERSEFLLFDLT
jgi:hypothetical protein